MSICRKSQSICLGSGINSARALSEGYAVPHYWGRLKLGTSSMIRELSARCTDSQSTIFKHLVDSSDR